MKLRILERVKNQWSPEPEDYDMEWQFLFLKIGKFKIDFFSDCGELFCYIYWGEKWWRFSTAGYLNYKD